MKIKNTYLLREEVIQLLNSFPEKHSKVKTIIMLIYDQGYKIGEAMKVVDYNKTARNLQRLMNRYSNGLITLADLRRSYICSNPTIIYERYSKKSKKEMRKNGKITPRLRWKILTRDKFRCKCCGASSYDTLLHVDHIIPVSLGGTNEPSNLRTLCSNCNMGRGNLILDLNLNTKLNTMEEKCQKQVGK